MVKGKPGKMLAGLGLDLKMRVSHHVIRRVLGKPVVCIQNDVDRDTQIPLSPPRGK